MSKPNRSAERTYILERQQYFPAPMTTVFPFFADARNLAAITPPWLGFRILTADPIEMAVGARIDYRIRLAGVPVHWRTRITQWEPGHGFVDEQEKGPYALWRHTHRFEEIGPGVLMTDRVDYRLRFGPLGGLAHALAVGPALARIFDYRFLRVRKLLA